MSAVGKLRSVKPEILSRTAQLAPLAALAALFSERAEEVIGALVLLLALSIVAAAL